MIEVTRRFTVIVPTRNRAGSLKNLLDSFESLEKPAGIAVELLVIDNGSTDGTRALLAREQEKSRKFPFAVLGESRKGKARALNRGLVEAKGEIIGILDDDVVVDPRWMMGHLECYRAGLSDAVQGRVLPGVRPDGKPADLDRLFSYNIPVVDCGDEIREVPGLTGSNMSFKREVFEKVGFFDVRLGPGASGFSEDTEYSMRIRTAGFKIGYTPHAIVYHELNPERYGRAYHRMVQYRKGLSRSLYRNESIAFRVLPDLLMNCMRFGFYTVLAKRTKAYATEGRIMRYWGYLRGKARKLAGRR